ncbi:MAG: hypothetical protein WCL21_18390 [Mariniphaga sp.]
MRAIMITFGCLFLLLLAAGKSFAQNNPDSTMLYRIETVNGNEYIGNIMHQDSLKIYFKSSQLGAITITRADIRNMNMIDAQSMKAGKYWYPNPQSTRYFWSPNGYGLKAGEAYYQNVWVLYNQISVGLTDYFSIGAGMIPLFLLGGLPSPVWIVPKLSIPVVKDKFNLGAGAIIGTVIGADTKGIGIVYGVSTFGNRDNNLSFGLGYGFAGGQWAKTPLINLSGMVRVSRSTYLLSENYFIGFGNDLFSMMSIGGRTLIHQSAGIDYGLIIPLNSGSNVALPWLGITVPFGKVQKMTKTPAR